MSRIKDLEKRLDILYKIKLSFPKEYIYNNMKTGKTKLGKKADRVNDLISKTENSLKLCRKLAKN